MRSARPLLPVVGLALVLVAGCGGPAPSDASPTSSTSAPDRPASSPSTSAAPPQAARPGRTADSQLVRLRPEQLVLPEGTVVPLVRTKTVEGVLEVPEDIRTAGWWDGGAYAGDPFGTTVLAGHVDSAQQGIGAFAELLTVKPGAEVAVRGEGRTVTYQVVSVRSQDKTTLATDAAVFDQRGPHSLVLITCTGTFDAARRHYDENLIVVAEPVAG